MNKFNSKNSLSISLKPDEKLLFSKVLDQAFICTRDHKNKFTEFINYSICEKLLESIKFNYDVNVSIFGGIDGCERVKLGLSPSYYTVEESEFSISSVEIQFPRFDKCISHRDILGSILGIGISRNKLGDILVYDSRAVVFVDTDVVDYICNNLQSIGRSKVKTILCSIEYLYMPIKKFDDINISVNSLRLCNIISNTFNLSRSKSVDLIKGKKVLINWERTLSSSYTLKEKDTITVRGYGRIFINELLGKTSKGMQKVNVHKYG